MISQILVSIDLSESSAGTLAYAGGMAAYLKAKRLHVVHVFTPQTTSDAISIPPIGELMADREKMLEAFVLKHQDKLSTPYSTELLLGFAAEEIISQSKQYDLVIMGCQGDTDLLEEVFGSVSSTVAQKAHCPTLLVPKMARFTDYNNIMYASDNISLSRKAVLKFMDFNDLFRATVHFVHVSDEERAGQSGVQEKLFAPLFVAPDLEFPFEIAEVSAESVHDGIKQYLAAHPIDLSIMVTKKRGFWERLFHRSETKQFALHPQTPLMVFHLD